MCVRSTKGCYFLSCGFSCLSSFCPRARMPRPLCFVLAVDLVLTSGSEDTGFPALSLVLSRASKSSSMESLPLPVGLVGATPPRSPEVVAAAAPSVDDVIDSSSPRFRSGSTASVLALEVALIELSCGFVTGFVLSPFTRILVSFCCLLLMFVYRNFAIHHINISNSINRQTRIN